MRGEQFAHRRGVAKSVFDDRHARIVGKQGDVGTFQGRVVEIIEIVEAHDERIEIAREQAFDEVAADEAGAAGDEDCHARLFRSVGPIVAPAGGPISWAAVGPGRTVPKVPLAARGAVRSTNCAPPARG